MLKLQIILGSTRDGRHADPVQRWVEPLARSHGAFEVEVLDLRDWPLPFFQETVATVGDVTNPTYSDPVVRHWNDKIGEGDAYLIITPEYNHAIPAVLKNAIDSVFFSYRFRRKPAAFVGYSLGYTAAARAVEGLVQVMVEMEAAPVRTATLIPTVLSAFDPAGQPNDPNLTVTLGVMLDDLAWLGKLFQAGRQGDRSQPAAVRIRAASKKRI